MALVALLLGTAGCERGCLSAWLADQGVGRSPGAEGLPADAGGLSAFAGGTDCSGGLARCQDGWVEVSRDAHVSASCGQRADPESAERACECPWERVGRCEAGCVAADLVAAVSEEEALTQLCRPTREVVRPPGSGEAPTGEICASVGIDCIGGVVRACDGIGRPVRPLVVCSHGCAARISVDPGDTKITDGAAVILCRRAISERP